MRYIFHPDGECRNRQIAIDRYVVAVPVIDIDIKAFSGKLWCQMMVAVIGPADIGARALKDREIFAVG